jgi:RNA polymerase sigma-70 factor, ECF subfamily
MSIGEKEFAGLIATHQRLIYKVCLMYARTHEERKDLFQEIVLQSWKSLNGFKGEAKFTTWLYRVALNTAISGLRKKSREPKNETLGDHHLNLSEQEEDRQDEVAGLHEAIRKLAEIDRAIMFLVLEEVPYEEIASLIGITQNNVRVKVSRIKMKLRKLLSNEVWN